MRFNQCPDDFQIRFSWFTLQVQIYIYGLFGLVIVGIDILSAHKQRCYNHNVRTRTNKDRIGCTVSKQRSIDISLLRFQVKFEGCILRFCSDYLFCCIIFKFEA
ncbi:hypothetical protein D3C73_1294750 [compost metagenome]